MRFVCVLLIASSVNFAQTTAADPKLDTSVKAGNQEWIDGMKSGDIVQITRAYANDAVNCSAAGECVRGIAEIRKQIGTRIAGLGKAISGSVTSDGLVPNGDLAYEWGRSTARFKDRSISGRFVTIWKKQPDGSWKIIRNLSLPPTP
jgi:ketosteroid isomerase-like protein